VVLHGYPVLSWSGVCIDTSCLDYEMKTCKPKKPQLEYSIAEMTLPLSISI
jgi:hypothetical protein